MQRGTLVLLVEDDADLGAVLEEVVSSRGYRAHLCRTGSEAVRMLEQELPALVILDWGLPDADPEELSELFHARGVTVVLASGAGRTRELADRIGAAATLEKPYAIDDVFRVLERFVGPPPLAENHS
jgi:DNA-binding response OmpR family regulator